MPQDRLLHPRSGHSDKVTELSDFEHRAWTQYLLSADDFGLMPCEGVKLQADNRALAKRPVRLVQKALERLVEIGLLLDYRDHQGRRYTCDPVWQKYQKVEYPKQTLNPQPPPEVLGACHPITQELFRQCFGKPSQKFRKPSSENSEQVQDVLAQGSRAREVANGKRLEANGKGVQGAAVRGPARGGPPLALGLKRLKVWRWMLDDFIETLGTHAVAFDIEAWLHALDERETGVIPSMWPWLRDELLAEVKRRGLPIAAASTATSTAEMARGMAEILGIDPSKAGIPS